MRFGLRSAKREMVSKSVSLITKFSAKSRFTASW
ncbi:Uncharacterised protein [Vibrio cholerae]|nr:Uncharacterised protein [Vibrio cholerae]CSI46249.1 Uncharacterised protein [Vibrio cholerae]